MCSVKGNSKKRVICKFCTCDILLKFAFVINIANMPAYDSPVLTEQLRHLRLRQPDGIVLQTDLQPHGLVGLVEDDLSLLQSVVLHGLYIVRHIRNLFSYSLLNHFTAIFLVYCPLAACMM
jgi:hypothetical protein